MLAQCVRFCLRMGEVSCPTKYFEEASSINFRRSVKYGFGVVATTLQFALRKTGGVQCADSTPKAANWNPVIEPSATPATPKPPGPRRTPPNSKKGPQCSPVRSVVTSSYVRFLLLPRQPPQHLARELIRKP